MGVFQSAPRFRMIVSQTFWQQPLKYANILLSWEDWEINIFLYSLCIEPWGDRQLGNVYFFATIPMNLWTQSCWPPEPGAQGKSLGGSHKNHDTRQGARCMYRLLRKYQPSEVWQRDSVRIGPTLQSLWRGWRLAENDQPLSKCLLKCQLFSHREPDLPARLSQPFSTYWVAK